MRFLVHKIYQVFDTKQLPPRLKAITLVGFRVIFVFRLLFTLLMTMYIDYHLSYRLFEACIMGIQSCSILMVSLLIFSASFNRILKEKNG